MTRLPSRRALVLICSILSLIICVEVSVLMHQLNRSGASNPPPGLPVASPEGHAHTRITVRPVTAHPRRTEAPTHTPVTRSTAAPSPSRTRSSTPTPSRTVSPSPTETSPSPTPTVPLCERDPLPVSCGTPSPPGAPPEPTPTT